jgi:hypothetical protein
MDKPQEHKKEDHNNRHDHQVPFNVAVHDASSEPHLPPPVSREADYTAKKWLGLAIAGTTVAGTLALTAPFVLQHFRSPLPYMATPKDKVRRALEFVAQRLAQRRGVQECQKGQSPRPPTTGYSGPRDMPRRHFVDMGSGDGEAVYQALHQRAGFQSYQHLFASATGIELNFTLWALSQIRRMLLWNRDERIRSSFLWRDLFAYSLQDADTVMIFGVKPLMISISQKLAQECRPGTFVLAYRFPVPLAERSSETDKHGIIEKANAGSNIPTTQPIRSEIPEVKLLAADLIYEEEEMRIYEVNAAKIYYVGVVD